jgi:TolB-like protein
MLAFVLVAAITLLRPAPNRSPTPDDLDLRTAAILPFTVMGDVDTSLALSNGLTDSLLAQLADVPGLQVVASASSSRLDAGQLGARYLVDGSAQLSGSSLRVTARLIDSHSDAVVWTEQFDRGRDDFFGMQDAVAASVKRALVARISNLDPTIPAGERSQNVEAHLAYLRGRALFGRTTIAGSVDAEREFARAHALDPGFVPAIVGLHDARMQLASLRKQDLRAALALNEPLLALAINLQPDSGAVQLARAIWSPGAAEARSTPFEQGLRKDPSNARAMTAYSQLLDGALNRPEEAKQWLDRALRIDPLWPPARFRAAHRNFRIVGSAVEHQNMKLLELDPTYYPSLQRHAKYRWQMHGDSANAVLVVERAIAADPENPWGLHTAVAFYLDANDPRSAANLADSNAVAGASTAAIRAQFAGD